MAERGPPQACDPRKPGHGAPRPSPLPGPPQRCTSRVRPQPGRWQRKAPTRKLVFCTPCAQRRYSHGTRHEQTTYASVDAWRAWTWSLCTTESDSASETQESPTAAATGMDLTDLALRDIKPDITGQICMIPHHGATGSRQVPDGAAGHGWMSNGELMFHRDSYNLGW